MPRVIDFDVNEALLDLRAFDSNFQRLFGDAAVCQEWFNQVLQSGLVTTVLGAYTDFGTVGGAALDMTAARHGVTLSAKDRTQLLGTIKSLPPRPDVREGLMRLREAGLRLTTLTNSTFQVAQANGDVLLARRCEQVLLTPSFLFAVNVSLLTGFFPKNWYSRGAERGSAHSQWRRDALAARISPFICRSF